MSMLNDGPYAGSRVQRKLHIWFSNTYMRLKTAIATTLQAKSVSATAGAVCLIDRGSIPMASCKYPVRSWLGRGALNVQASPTVPNADAVHCMREPLWSQTVPQHRRAACPVPATRSTWVVKWL